MTILLPWHLRRKLYNYLALQDILVLSNVDCLHRDLILSELRRPLQLRLISVSAIRETSSLQSICAKIGVFIESLTWRVLAYHEFNWTELIPMLHNVTTVRIVSNCPLVKPGSPGFLTNFPNLRCLVLDTPHIQKNIV